MEDVKTTAAAAADTEASDKEAALLAARLNAAAKSDETNSSGMDISFISVATMGAQAIDKTNIAMYIQGLEVGDYYIQSKKLKLGDKLRVVPLAFIPMYSHYTSRAKDKKYLGVVSGADGRKVPVMDFTFPSGKKNFSVRECADHTVLEPSFWVPVFLPDFPDITNGVITFKSTGTEFYKAWKKDVKAHSVEGPIASNLYMMGWHKLTNTQNPSGWLVPEATFIRNMAKTPEKGETGFLLRCLDESIKIVSQVTHNTLCLPFTDSSAHAALPDAKAALRDDDGEEEEDFSDDDALDNSTELEDSGSGSTGF